MKKISACLVVRREEKTIKRCLESLGGAVDEIIIVHDGECADKTLEIASAYTNKIFSRPFFGSMEKHLVFALNQAQGDWILRLDADEFLSLELRDNLRRLAEQEEIAGYEFLWPYWAGGKQLTKNLPYKRCFFEKKKMSFLAIPHFLTVVSGKLKKVDLVLEHRPLYDNFSWAIFKNKWIPWAEIQAKCYLEPFDKIEKFNYKKSDWPLAIRLRRKYPLIFMFPDFFYSFGKTFLLGWRENPSLFLKIALFTGLYRYLIDYYLFKFSHNNS